MNEAESNIPLNARSLHFRWRGWTFDFSFDDEFLTSTWTSCGNTEISRTPLRRLMDDFVVDTPRSATLLKQARRFRYAVVLGLVVQFSEIPSHVPFLAPALFVFAAYCLLKGGRHLGLTEQTRVLTNYGEQIIAIPHLTALEASRSRFEEQLRIAIQSAKARNR